VDGSYVSIGLEGSSVPKSTSPKGTLFANGFDPKSKVIVIDAGHGGKDGGAVGYKRYTEKKIVLQVALKLGKELKRRGYRIYYTRTKDKFIQLRDRTKIANDKNADLFLSIHANAAPKKSRYLSMKGLETFFLSPARSERSKNVAALENKSDIDEMNHFSKQTYLNFLNREKIIASNKMALDVQQGMLSSLRSKYTITDGGVREAPFWVLVGAQMPSILIEIGYITNPTDAQNMVNPTYQDLLVKGIAGGVDSYFYKNY
jgi:N-acetylmuramoyl-L-alanine amidase